MSDDFIACLQGLTAFPDVHCFGSWHSLRSTPRPGLAKVKHFLRRIYRKVGCRIEVARLMP
jgi:hypothetical protein